MKKGADGSYSPSPGFLKLLMDNNTLFQDESIPSYSFLEYDPLLDSSDMRPTNWIQIARSIRDNYQKYNGFVVIHGTDTLTYTSSALSFLLTNIDKPVVVTGSQVPMVEEYNDAVNNLLGSLLVASNEDVKEVTVFFKDLLMRGNRAVKYSSVNWDGFAVGDKHYLGKWNKNLTLNKLELLPTQKTPSDSLESYTDVSLNVRLVMVYPGLSSKAYLQATSDADGIVLIVSANGTLPESDQELMKAIRQRAVDEKRITVIVSHCFNGYVGNMYESKYGAIGLNDMTLEAAYTKMCWLLARKDLSFEDRQSLMKMNIRGEMLTVPLRSLSHPTPKPFPDWAIAVIIIGVLFVVAGVVGAVVIIIMKRRKGANGKGKGFMKVEPAALQAPPSASSSAETMKGYPDSQMQQSLEMSQPSQYVDSELQQQPNVVEQQLPVVTASQRQFV
eukprot:MONOS_5194.1-p1 / transcript=MONOS_5194.1 / gene=MONOS_5194 / organism=Monocercomonoides_exilis_PA203 / gene_product=Asparaginase / transcript_product=Asparaginase / location=Mono_scaffold00148:80855-82418(+) / protein_length=444 / sequence_SO=supercontig / SO=protein_coding / is_pseudo=false